ncbi:MAG TPA: hypothetical protein VEI97_13250 [bacterium]|nr:hypothetical protein [bacterium]
MPKPPTDPRTSGTGEERTTLRVSIDGQPRTVSLEGLTNFGELMERIERELIPPGRVVTGVALNEESISMEQEELLHGFGVEGVGSLKLETAEPRLLAVDSLLHANDYLPQLAQALESIGAAVRGGRLESALGRLDAALDLLQHFLAVLDGVRTVMRIDYAKVILETDEGGNLAALQSRLAKRVEELLDASEQEDWHLAGEIAGYELAPLVYQFQGVMPLLLDQVIPMVPEYRQQILGRLQQGADPLSDIWGGGDDEDDDLFDDEDEDGDNGEAGGDIYMVKKGGGNGHSDPDDVTEAMLDDFEEEWDRHRRPTDDDLPEGDPGSKPN